uniref:RNA-polymerase II-associated protein 3-like C-terminal domain-containing protein n=1 Tax=Clastoptera arizonana TaxID=38151 RepID=A0A1B6ECH7_9HEMI
MVHENTKSVNNKGDFMNKSLLSKYNIPIENLSYEYIENCKNPREIEKIVKILRSKEEGFYPHLTQKAEDKLRLLDPNNHILVEETPVENKYSMDQKDWNKTCDDLERWTEKMKLLDSNLETSANTTIDIHLPPVRRSVSQQMVTTGLPKIFEVETKSQRIPINNYKMWDKYDADTEIMKIDLEEEKKLQKISREKKLKNGIHDKKLREERVKQIEKDLKLQELIEDTKNLTEMEKNSLAENARQLGNEYYKNNQIEEALEYYIKSITILPKTETYNNRALCYLKLSIYSKVIDDTNVVLLREPDNIKAHYRRAIALKELNRLDEALIDLDFVTSKQPNFKTAINMATEMRKKINEMKLPPRSSKTIKNSPIDSKHEFNKIKTKLVSVKDLNDGNFSNSESNEQCKRINIMEVEEYVNDNDSFNISEHLFSVIDKRSKVQKNNATQNNKIIDEDCDNETSYDLCLDAISKMSTKDIGEEIHFLENHYSGDVQKKENDIIKRPSNKHKERSNINERMSHQCLDFPINSNSIAVMETSMNTRYYMGGDSPKLKKRKTDPIHPFQFRNIWFKTSQQDIFFEQLKMLRSVDSTELTRLIGNQLDERMLIGIVRCLKFFLDTESRECRVKSFLAALAGCERLQVVMSMLSAEDVNEIRELMRTLMGRVSPNDETILHLMNVFPHDTLVKN